MKLFGWWKKNKKDDLKEKKTIGEYIDDMERPSLLVPVPYKVGSVEEIEGFVGNAISQIDIANKAFTTSFTWFIIQLSSPFYSVGNF